MRAAVSLSLWAVAGFDIFNLINGLPALLADTNTFTSVVVDMHRLHNTHRYVILHHVVLALSTKLREFQYKILNRILYTNDMLFKLKKKMNLCYVIFVKML